MGIFYHKKLQANPQPFKSQDLHKIASQFCLQRKEIHQFYKCFQSFQTGHKSYLILNDIAFKLNRGYPNFAELPYLQRLFDLISKKTGKVFFEDYLTGISTFCLMSKEAVLRFVFDWLDNDCDERVSASDITLAAKYINSNTTTQTFFTNFIPDIQKMFKNQPRRLINFDVFHQERSLIHFIIWPAYQLQQKLRDKNLGRQFWNKQYLKIQKSQMILKNSDKKAIRMLQKIRLLGTIKINRQNQFSSIHQQQKSRRKGKIANDIQLLQVQRPKRRKSCPYLKPTISFDIGILDSEND